MEHPRAARTAAVAAPAAAVLVAALAACGGGGGGQGEERGPGAEAAERLGEAQLVQYEDAKVVPEAGERGTYGKLSGVERTEELRSSTDLDKPECMDAATSWGSLPEVRKAPASVAVFARGDDTVSHTLLKVPEGVADEALQTVTPEKECASYKATMEDGSTSSYSVSEVDMDPVGDASRAFAVKTETGGDTVWMYSVVYRNGGHLGAATVLGPDEKGDYGELLSGFAASAVEREEKVL
ncbi:hypothetical protein [Nocardiopsis suaedae]|uniref:Lipoprotein n=1 Tax=Nocardiopsis suaedae TaxID=3018444 RepID=A0ABT4TM09_9ACTN|nr:hypothetical protein [Nocardiopsis suaedae]MDA2805739.1 hypothetical protein [Nocardiopsis suaedae]